MKKTMKRISALALTGVLGMTALAGCKQTQRAESDQTLEVYIIDTGYRTEGVRAILDSFAQQDWVKEKYPNLVIKEPTTNNMEGFALNKIKTPKNNEFDLLFSSDELMSTFEKNSKGEYALVDLTEILYNSEVLDQPGKKYIDAIQDSYIDYLGYTSLSNDTPKYFQVPWVSGMSGFIYSEEILAKYGYTDGKTPNTTDEMIALCQAIKDNPANSGNDKGYSFINHSGYWGNLMNIFWAQYDGLETYNNFWFGTIVTSRGPEYSNKIFEEEGRLKSLEFIYELVAYRDGAGYYDVENSNKGDFMQRQTMNLKGQYAMGANADWFDSEMRTTYELLKGEGITPHTIKIMKAPIISALVDKLDTIKTDEKLSAVITAIDEGKTYEETKETISELSEKDYNRIVEAKGVYASTGVQHNVVIPTTSNSQDVALDVLKYMATKDCQEAYMKATRGQSMPFDYDYEAIPQEIKESLSPMHQDRLAHFYNKDYPIHVLQSVKRRPLVRFGGLSAFASSNTNYNTMFCLENVTQTPQNLFDDTIKHWSKATFDFALQQAGYLDGQG